MFQSMPIKFPSFIEQTLIANFLSSIDEKTETEKKILQQYETQKKYLLQNMFV
jgi:type I restriction enzyme S subunit